LSSPRRAPRPTEQTGVEDLHLRAVYRFAVRLVGDVATAELRRRR
jgi:hypothetical protein